MTDRLPIEFHATIIKSPAAGGWMYVRWPSVAEHFGTRGLVKVAGSIDGHPFSSALMPLGDGAHKLPVTQRLAKSIGKGVGDEVVVRIDTRR